MACWGSRNLSLISACAASFKYMNAIFNTESLGIVINKVRNDYNTKPIAYNSRALAT